jgi:hypothetical protein
VKLPRAARAAGVVVNPRGSEINVDKAVDESKNDTTLAPSSEPVLLRAAPRGDESVVAP